jgi:type IX secretion system PorP/SprF family membrane protein
MKYIQYLPKPVLFLLLVFLMPAVALAQQEPVYTHYKDNMVMVNPGYAGISGVGNLMAISRNQWVSFPGAPNTAVLSFQTPVKELNMGIGLSVMSDKIGPLSQTGIFGDYSYSIRVSDTYRLSLGLKGGFTFYRASLADLETIRPDPVFERDLYRNFLPNFGVGGFVYSDDTWFGLSVPRLVENSISRENLSTEYIMKEKMHFYLTGGKTMVLSDEISLKAHSMMRIVKNAPVSLELTSLAGIRNKLWLGGFWRTGNSIGLITQVMAFNDMIIGYSYDMNISKMNTFSSGTHEIMVGYNLHLFK